MEIPLSDSFLNTDKISKGKFPLQKTYFLNKLLFPLDVIDGYVQLDEKNSL